VRPPRSVGIQRHQAGARTGGAQGDETQRLTGVEVFESEADRMQAEHAEKTHRADEGPTQVHGSPNTGRTHTPELPDKLWLGLDWC
jgi:hypothetical protein